MKNDKISIVIIGAGETGTPLLKQLLDAEFVQVIGIADLDENAPGMEIARQKGIETTTNYMKLVEKGEEVDIIIEVTGVPNVREELRHYMQEAHNQHTIIMHEKIALLMMSLSKGHLVKMKHSEMEYK
ncbi:oxidoreductase [Aneurinibacillus terranovensis]|uniref:oxidoreductase n=1 Tax=Aneurinibacillus terranovensis TaxID=278991 RepID=UPI00040305E2|nr:oxidoreductase [Aneurinibacillus terranovensis]